MFFIQQEKIFLVDFDVFDFDNNRRMGCGPRFGPLLKNKRFPFHRNFVCVCAPIDLTNVDNRIKKGHVKESLGNSPDISCLYDCNFTVDISKFSFLGCHSILLTTCKS